MSRAGRWLAAAAGASVLAFLVGCQEAPVRPELVLYVDIDMPVRSQASEAISPDAIFDSVRIELYRSADNSLIDARTFDVSSADVLPLSLGIRSDAVQSSDVLVRVRAFRAAFAEPGKLDGVPVLDPRPQVSIDRLVALELPSEGLAQKSVVLRGDCMGIRSRFGIGDSPDSTCIDGEQLSGDTAAGIADGALDGTLSGTWKKAAVVDCGDAQAPPGAVCVPGGFAVLGDPLFLAIDEYERDAVPLRPMTLRPFFMDETEVTVGTLRELVDAGYDGPLPMAPDPLDALDKFCSWSPDTDPAFAVSCISVDLADAVCAARGGRVPREAEWEYAARGRGKRDIFVWGEATDECCNTSVGFFPGGGCGPEGPEPVASHTGDGCIGDVTDDGIVDLNGGMSELTRDSIASFSDPCWASQTSSEILSDPECVSVPGRIGRGGNWNDTLGRAALPVRDTFAELDPAHGFRCVYEVP